MKDQLGWYCIDYGDLGQIETDGVHKNDNFSQ